MRKNTVVMNLVLVFLFIQQYCFAQEVKVLTILANNYGPNFLMNFDQFEEFGWSATLTGVTEEVKPCPLFDDLPYVKVDMLVTDITNVMDYDVIALMPASWRTGSPYSDIMASPKAMELIKTAVDSGLIVWTSCAGVRVLAALDVLRGKSVVGTQKYHQEYEDAGATYLGADHPPVTDGNIITCVRDQYYYIHNIEAISTALEKSPRHQLSAKNKSAYQFKSQTFSLNDEDILWSKTFGHAGSEGGRSIIATDDGGFVITGYTYSTGAGRSDVYLLKTTADGEEKWSKTFGGSGWEYSFSVIQTADLGYLITGYTTSLGAGSKDVYLIKTDNQGNLIWEKTYGGENKDVGRAVCETQDGGFLICGYTDSYTAGEEDIYVIRTDDNGDSLWTKTIGEERSEIGRAVCELDDGNFMLLGATGSSISTGNQDAYLVKIDPSGNKIWHNTFGNKTSFPFDWGNAFCQTEDNGFVITGSTNIRSPMDVLLIKSDSLGNQKSYMNFGEDFYDYGHAICQTEDGGYLVCGTTKNFATIKNDLYVRRLDNHGKEIWTKIIGGDFSDWGSAICQTPDGFVLTGHTNSFGNGDYDVWLLKISNIFQDMEIIPNTGHAPLKVNFMDHSFGQITDFQWDLNNDGQIDSYEQSPEFTYETPGIYSVSRKVSNNSISKSFEFEDCIKIFNGESALNFENDTSYAECKASEQLNLTQALTLEAWICPEGWGGFDFGRIIDKMSFTFHIKGEGPGLNVNSLAFFQSNHDGSMCFSNTPINSIKLNEWQHVAISYDADSSRVKMYINGVEQTLNYLYGLPNGPIYSNLINDLTIGNSSDYTLGFNGHIDEVRVWNRVRSGDEILCSMNDYLTGAETGLVGYWPMNEGYGPTLSDTSPFEHTMEINAAGWDFGLGPDILTSTQEFDHDLSIPVDFVLNQNYPNPFNPSTTVSFGLPVDSRVCVAIYNINGRQIKDIVNNEKYAAGYHALEWNGTNENSVSVGTGVYFVQIRTENFTQTRKMLLLR